jgi:hypothetical protein
VRFPQPSAYVSGLTFRKCFFTSNSLTDATETSAYNHGRPWTQATRRKNIAEPVRVYSVEVGKPGERSKSARAARIRLLPALAALAAILALAGAVAWYWIASRPGPNIAAAAPFGVPTVAVLPFANVTGDPQYETLTQRIGQKMRDATSSATIWRIVARPGARPAAPPTRSTPGGS